MSADRVPAYWDPDDRLCFAAPSTHKRDESNAESLGGVVLTGRWICEGRQCGALSDIPRVHKVADMTGAPYCSQDFNGSRWVLNPEHPAECRCCERRDKARLEAAQESDDGAPFTLEEIAAREANRQQPLTADALASIERDIAAADATDPGLIFLDACMLLREVRRLREAHAAWVAEERARCLAIVDRVHAKRYSGEALSACRDIADAIKDGK